MHWITCDAGKSQEIRRIPEDRCHFPPQKAKSKEENLKEYRLIVCAQLILHYKLICYHQKKSKTCFTAAALPSADRCSPLFPAGARSLLRIEAADAAVAKHNKKTL